MGVVASSGEEKEFPGHVRELVHALLLILEDMGGLPIPISREVGVSMKASIGHFPVERQPSAVYV